MKRAIALVVFVSLVAATAAWADPPAVENGTVTLPWTDFKALLDKLQTAPPPDDPAPPVDFALGRGELTGSLDQRGLDVTAAYALTVFKRGWVVCPLVPTGTPLAEATLDGQPAPITNYDGRVALVVRGPATYKLAMRFRVGGEMRPGPGSLSVGLPEAAGHLLRLAVGDKLAGVTVDGATMSTDGATVVAVLTGDQLTARYTVALEKQAEEATEKLPPKVLVENQTLVSIDEGFVRAVCQLNFEVRHAPVQRFEMTIPAGFDVADVSGASLIGWRLDEADRTLTADIGFEVKGAYVLTLVLERSTREESFTLPLPAVPVVGAERDRGYFAVQVTGGVEVTTGDKVENLQVIDAKDLPGELRGGATNPIVLSFKFLRHPFAADLRVVRHQTQAVLGAAIDAANYVVQLTADGDAVVRAVYTVRNNRKQFLELTLPAADRVALWSSFVADKPVRPSKTKEGTMLLPLEKSSYDAGELRSFNVEVIYYLNLAHRLRGLGTIDLAMPLVDLPISRSALTVFAPANLAYRRIGGSLDRTGAVESSFFGRLADEIPATGAMAPSPIMARKSDYAIEEKQAAAEQVFQQRLRAAQDAQDQTGALPARFVVPEEGTSLRFSELLTIGEASSVKLAYLSRSWLSYLGAFAFLLAAALAWFAAAVLARGKRWFVVACVLMALLVAAGVSIGYLVAGAVLGVGGRFAQWVVRQILKNAR